MGISLRPAWEVASLGIWKDTRGKFEQEQKYTDHTVTLKQTFEGHSNAITSIAYSVDGHRLASGGWDELIQIWDIRQDSFTSLQKLQVKPTKHIMAKLLQAEAVIGLDFSPDGHWLASIHTNGIIRIWEDRQGKFEQLQVLKHHYTQEFSLKAREGRFKWIAFMSDGILAVSEREETIRVPAGRIKILKHDHKEFKEIQVLSPGRLLAANGDHLACTNSDNLISIWRRSGSVFQQTQEIPSEHRTRSAAFSCGGRQLASGSDRNGQIQIWAMKDDGQFELVQVLGQSSFRTHSLAFLADGRLASVQLRARKIEVRIWEMGT